MVIFFQGAPSWLVVFNGFAAPTPLPLRWSEALSANVLPIYVKGARQKVRFFPAPLRRKSFGLNFRLKAISGNWG